MATAQTQGKQLVDTVMRERSAANLWFQARYGKYQDVPAIPRGNERLELQVGDAIQTTARSTFKPGLRGRIQDIHREHGFNYYTCKLSCGSIATLRTRDIERAA